MAGSELAFNDLDALLDQGWALIEAATTDRHAALRWPVVSTICDDGPAARVMVLRGSDRARHRLRFWTDARADKVAELAVRPRVAVTGYDADVRLQLRLHGRGALLQGPAVDADWASIDANGRRAYSTTLPPGSRLDQPGTGLPADLDTMHPDDPPSEAARANFAVLEVVLDTIELLSLASAGQRRARYKRSSDTWTGAWLVP